MQLELSINKKERKKTFTVIAFFFFFFYFHYEMNSSLDYYSIIQLLIFPSLIFNTKIFLCKKIKSRFPSQIGTLLYCLSLDYRLLFLQSTPTIDLIWQTEMLYTSDASMNFSWDNVKDETWLRQKVH